jgi:Trypsin-like peptidase domain
MINTAKLRRVTLALILFALLPSTTLISNAHPQNAGAQAVQNKFRLTRSISGSKGYEQTGRYIVDDPRTVFKVPDDRQVLVYLEWEGVAGLHEFEGRWKNPAGKLVAVSDFKLEVRGRTCSGFFTLLLSETSELGLWTLEAVVDGEVTGQHKFQVVSASDPGTQTAVAPAQANPTGPPPEQPRQPLTESQIYDIANSSTILVEKLDSKGQPVDRGSAFFVDADLLLTAFQVIDGADKLRVFLPDGRRLESQEVVSWDRWQDWAFIKVGPAQKGFIKFSQTVDAPVGSRVYALAISASGARVLVRCDIVGKSKFPQNGERINLNCTHPDVIGSPLLDEYGDLIGVIGGSMIPGWASTKKLPGVYYNGSQLANANPGLVAVPIKSFSKPDSARAATTFSQLASDGTFTSIISRFENIQYGTLARHVETKPVPRTIDDTYEFRNADPLIVFLEWRPKEKVKGASIVRIYDLAGHLLTESKPSKVDVKPAPNSSYTWWKAEIASLKPGIYRVDVLVDSSPIWRAFFKVRE